LTESPEDLLNEHGHFLDEPGSDVGEPPPIDGLDGPTSADQAPAAKIPKLKVINPAEWEGKPKPERKWIIPDVIPDETITILYGDGGLGKSLVMLQLAAARSITTETTDWLGFAPKLGRTLVLSTEDDADEMQRRFDDILIHYGTAWADLKDVRLIDLVGEDSYPR
jgi:RecA-family ATPase